MSQVQLLAQQPFPPMSNRRMMASDPNTEPELLLALATEYPFEVRDNPVLPLLGLERPELYEEFRKRLLPFFQASLLFGLENPALIPLGDLQISHQGRGHLRQCLQRPVLIRGLVLAGTLEDLYLSDIVFGNVSQAVCVGRMGAGLFSGQNTRALFNEVVPPGLDLRVDFDWEGVGVGKVSGYFAGERVEERRRR